MKNFVDDLINSFTPEEYREFKYFLMRRSDTAEDRKDLLMLENIRDKTPLAKSSANATYQIKKRLKKQLEEFAILKTLHLDKSSEIRMQMDIAKYLFHKNLYTSAWDYLAKAEKLANQVGEYILLDQILGIQISYVYNISVPAADGTLVPNLINKMLTNKALDVKESYANAAYCELIYEIKKGISQDSMNIEELKTNIFKKYGLNEKHDITYLTGYCNYMNIIFMMFREARKYKELRERGLNCYHFLHSNNLLDRLSDNFVFNLLDHICASTIRVKDYINYEKFIGLYLISAKKMQAGSREKTYYDFTPYIDLADLYIVTNRLSQARERLLTAKKLYGSFKQSTRIFYLLRINLMDMHFICGEYDECIKLYQEVISYDEKKILKELYFTVEDLLLTNIYGVLFYYEDGNTYYAHRLLTQLKRKYAALLKSKMYAREHSFIKILHKIFTVPSYINSKIFLSDANKFVVLKSFMPADWEYISLNVWLVSKCTHRKYYDCFLEEVKPNIAYSQKQ